jgi:DNA-binding MarR family transcriptional regulator
MYASRIFYLMTKYLENLLGAVCLSMADKMEEAATEAAGLEGRAAAALVLVGMAPGMTIKQLAERLRLSHAGAVRLVQRLDGGQLLKREGSHDRREVRLSLSRKGGAAVERIRAARGRALSEAASALSGKESAMLGLALVKLMHRLTPDRVAAYTNCRLCDVAACEASGCPVTVWGRRES